MNPEDLDHALRLGEIEIRRLRSEASELMAENANLACENDELRSMLDWHVKNAKRQAERIRELEAHRRRAFDALRKLAAADEQATNEGTPAMIDHDADAVVERCIQARIDCHEPIMSYDMVARVTLAALKPGDRLPGGLVCVPAELTRRQRDVAANWILDDEGLYRAMLAASTD